MTFQWVAADTRTGEILEDFPDLNPGNTGVTHTMSAYNTTTVSFPVDGTAVPPVNWFDSTRPFARSLFAISDDESPPQWGALINQRNRAGGSDVQLSVVTFEAYLMRRFIRETRQYPNADRLQIGADLVRRYVIDGAAGRNGLPLRVVVDGIGQATDGDYKDSDDRSIYSVFGDLGFEWTIGYERLHDPERFGLVLTLSEQLGGATASDTLQWPGRLLTAAGVVEDYSDGKGANDVLATSTGQGDVRPQSDHQSSVAANMPTVEARVSAGSNITRKDALNAYAREVLSARKGGAIGYTATLSQIAYMNLGVSLGDYVSLDFSGPEFPDHPTGTLRVAGLQINKNTVSPVLAGADDEDDSGGDS